MTSTDTSGTPGPGWVQADLLHSHPDLGVDPLLIAEIDEVEARVVEALDPWRCPPPAPVVGTGTRGPDRGPAPGDRVARPRGEAEPRSVDATQRSPPARQCITHGLATVIIDKHPRR